MDILAILAALGIEVPQEKQEALKTAFTNELGKVTAKLETERDTLKDNLKTARDTLKTFEGVDVDKLNGKITQLTSDLAAKDTEYQAKIADMEFNSVLDTAISGSKARNSKTVKALLDLEALKASKNQSEDIKAAIEKVKAENDFLFESSEPIKNPVAPTGVPDQGGKKMTLLEAMKYKNEHPDADVNTLI